LTGSIVKAEYTWHSEYATVVHEGATFRRDVRFKSRRGVWVTIKAGTVYPPRRWVQHALAQFNFVDKFATLCSEYIPTMGVEAASAKAFRDCAMMLSVEFVKSMSSTHWTWTGGESRDIVDTGQLRASQQLNIT
jgi:hypothetical protein